MKIYLIIREMDEYDCYVSEGMLAFEDEIIAKEFCRAKNEITEGYLEEWSYKEINLIK